MKELELRGSRGEEISGEEASTVGSLEGPVQQPQAKLLEVAEPVPPCACVVEGRAQLSQAKEECNSPQQRVYRQQPH